MIGKLNAKYNSCTVWNKYAIWHPKIWYQLLKDVYTLVDAIHGPIDTISPLKRDAKLHGPKVQVHVRSRKPMFVADIKAIKNKFNVSVNDVITALFAGGIRKYILSEDAEYFTNVKDFRVQKIFRF